MKLRNLLLVFALVAILVSGCNSNNPKNLTMKDRTDSISYIVGVGLAKDVLSRDYKVNNDMVLKGYLDGIDSVDVLKDSAFVKLIRDFNKELKDQELAKLKIEFDANMDAGKKFIDNIKLQPNIKELPSGLLYGVIAEGKGPKASENSTIKVNYTIYTIDGKEKKNTNGSPETLAVNKIEIAGMKEGVQLMNTGAKYRFYMPANIAFRDQVGISIPVGSTIIMDVEMVEIK